MGKVLNMNAAADGSRKCDGCKKDVVMGYELQAEAKGRKFVIFLCQPCLDEHVEVKRD